MKTYAVTLTGETPILMHHDNLAWADTMKAWSTEPANKAASVAGDDRSPAWRWIGNLYVENDKVVIPSDNLMTVLREGGKRVSTGKRGASFKAQTQSGIIVDQSAWPVIVDGKEVPYGPFRDLIENSDYSKHEKMAHKFGFVLFAKRAPIGTSKHVRVRPRFDRWSCSGTMTVLDELITLKVLTNILEHAGKYAGLCDWRPSSPKSPGPFGKFKATVTEMN